MGLLTDNQWAAIEGRLCLVTNFDPWATLEKGRIRAFFGWATPYACVQLKCENSTQDITGFISHKTEFAMLWAAFNKRTELPGTWLDAWSPGEYNPDGLGENEEVWLIWTRKNYLAAARLFSRFLPRLIVMVSRKGAFELVMDREERLRPRLKGMARFKAKAPLVTWTPRVMRR